MIQIAYVRIMQKYCVIQAIKIWIINMDNKIIVINPSDRAFFPNRYILAFGAYGWTKVMVWASYLGDALDEAIDWAADNAPGLLCDDMVTEAYEEAIAQGMSEEDAYEEATTDVTCGGNNGHYVLSYEWHIVAENPSREDILRLQGRIK